jgi:hypothetical protein
MKTAEIFSPMREKFHRWMKKTVKFSRLFTRFHGFFTLTENTCIEIQPLTPSA